MAHTSPQSELDHLNRLLHIRTLVRSFAWCAVYLGLLTGGILLSLRLFGLEPSPNRWWLLGLLVPLAWALRASRRETPDPAIQAGWLDRKRQLGGLLLTSRELDLGPWQGRLESRLAQSVMEDPNLGCARPPGATSAANLLRTLVVLLPPRARASQPWETLQAHRLQRFVEQLEKLEETKALDEEEIRSLQERVRALQQKLDDGESLDWEEVDGLDRLLEQSRHERLVRLQEALNSAKTLQEAMQDPESDLAEHKAPALQDLLEKLEDAGILADIPLDTFEALSSDPLDSPDAASLQLPEGLAQTLGRMDAEGKALPSGLPMDPASLEKLAAALGKACEGACEALAQEGLGAADLEDLESLLAEYEACLAKGSSAAGREVEGVGKGGVDEGPGHAKLQYDNETQGDTSALQVRRLPKGRRPSTDWQTVGVSRGDPEVAPVRAEGGDQGASAGTKASHRRRLSPHHREVVRRYFSETKSKKK